MKKNILINVVLLYFTFILTTPAYAYIDPGTVSILLQTILAAIAGIGATYRLWIFKVKSFFKKKKDTKK